jgi:predicted nucleotidyltransferase
VKLPSSYFPNLRIHTGIFFVLPFFFLPFRLRPLAFMGVRGGCPRPSNHSTHPFLKHSYTDYVPLPTFNEQGDLPVGVHKVSLAEFLERFGSDGGQRALVTRRLLHVLGLAKRTGYLKRFVVFGSYVTSKAAPNDADVILVMDDGFDWKTCPIELLALFDHAVAQVRYGVSIFWTRPSALLRETIDEYIAYWQVKRDKTLRGIVEIILEEP